MLTGGTRGGRRCFPARGLPAGFAGGSADSRGRGPAHGGTRGHAAGTRFAVSADQRRRQLVQRLRFRSAAGADPEPQSSVRYHRIQDRGRRIRFRRLRLECRASPDGLQVGPVRRLEAGRQASRESRGRLRGGSAGPDRARCYTLLRSAWRRGSAHIDSCRPARDRAAAGAGAATIRGGTHRDHRRAGIAGRLRPVGRQ